MSLLDTKNSFLACAKILPDKYENYTIEYLADNYCKATDEGDEDGRSVYCAALMLRFWYTIDKMYKASLSMGLEREDFVMWLYDAIEYACKYRAWQNPDKNVNASTCINQCINTIRLQKYYNANLAKNRSNYNTISLDAEIDGSEDGTTSADLLVGDTGIDRDSYNVYAIIQGLLDTNNIVEAIIIDNIAFKDVFKHKKHKASYVNDIGEEVKYTEHTSKFWSFKLVQELGKLDKDYVDHFKQDYSVGEAQFNAAFDALTKANNQKKYKMIDSALKGLRKVLA